MNLKPLDSALSSVSDRLTEVNTIDFIEKNSKPNTILDDVKSVLSRKDKELYSKVNYHIHTNMMVYHANGSIFENISNTYIAMFLLAGTIIMTSNVESNDQLIRSAFVALSLALDDGEDSLKKEGIDIEKMKIGILKVETLYPDIYE